MALLLFTMLDYHQYVLMGLIFAFSIWVLRWFQSVSLRLPPGPPGWPIIGNMLILFEKPGTTNDQWAYTRHGKKYGSIYTLHFGSQRAYVLCDIDYVRKTFSHPYIQGKMAAGHAYEVAFGPGADGIIFESGARWKKIRHFMLEVFRDLGVGRGIFEEKIQLEIVRLCQKLDNSLDETCMNLDEHLHSAISNIICGITFGQQFEYSNEQFQSIVNIAEDFVKAIGPGGMVLTNKLLRRLPFGPGKNLKNCLQRYKKFHDAMIKERKKMLKVSHDRPNNFVDAFLAEMVKGDDVFTEENLTTCGFELFFAGTTTTTQALAFAIFFLVTHPEVQAKCQKEIDDVVATFGSIPGHGDRSRLPYICAVILESHRLGIIVPQASAHVVEKDIELFGYDFPKGTVVLQNVGSLFMNEKQFPNPHKFNPDRYIKDGSFEAHPDIIMFSVGRRSCPGEQLARAETFLFLANLLHKYTFTAPNGMKMPSTVDGCYNGATRNPLPFGVKISKRVPGNAE